MGLRQGRSPFGAFIQSPFGARGLADNKYTINGVSGVTCVPYTYIRILNAAKIGEQFSNRQDNPFGTQNAKSDSTISDIVSNRIGVQQTSGPTVFHRVRYGITFALGTYATGTVGRLLVSGSTNTGSPGITIGVSNTDDHGSYGSGGWDNNFDTIILNSGGSPGAVTAQISNTVLSAHYGANISFVIATQIELNSTNNSDEIYTLPNNLISMNIISPA